MSEPRVQGSARVTVTVEFSLPSTWGTDCQLEQIHRQASKEALAMIDSATRGQALYRIIGKPVVQAIITERMP